MIREIKGDEPRGLAARCYRVPEGGESEGCNEEAGELYGVGCRPVGSVSVGAAKEPEDKRVNTRYELSPLRASATATREDATRRGCPGDSTMRIQETRRRRSPPLSTSGSSIS